MAKNSAELAKTSQVLQDSGLYFLGNVASRAIGFLAIPFYSHYLTPAQYGVIELIELSTQIIAVTFGLQAVGSVLTRFFHDQRSAAAQSELISTGLIFNALLSGVIAIIASFAAEPLSNLVFHSPREAPLLQVAFMAMWFANMVEVALVHERIRGRAWFFFWYSMISLILMLSLNIYFIGFANYGVYGFIYSKLIATGIGTCYLVWRSLREVGVHWRQKFIPQFIRFGLPLCFASISAFAIHFSDRFFLADVVPLREIGQYALAYRFAFLVSIFVGDSFGKSWNVVLFRLAGLEGWKTHFAHVAHYLMFALYLTGLSICLMAPTLLSFMVPESFFPPTPVLSILVFSYVLRECGDYFRNLMLINKRSDIVGNVSFGSAIANLLLNFAFIPAFGIMGAALATMCTWLLYMLVFWVISWREHHIPVRIPSFLFISVISLLIFSISRALPVGPGVLSIAINSAFILIFVAICLYFYFSKFERQEVIAFAVARVRGLIASRANPGNQGDVGTPRLMVLAFYFPPENTIGAARPARFAKYLSRLGYRITVISRWIEGDGGADSIRVPQPGTAGAKFFSFAGLLGSFNRFILPYDDRLGWVPSGVRAASAELARRPNQVIFSTHPPVATHLVALILKWRFACPWIADFRDPLLGNPFREGRRAHLFDVVLERLIIGQADAVIANTDAVRRMWVKRYPQWQSKIHLIWNGFDSEDRVTPKPINPRHRRILAHVGTIYGGRTPEPLIASLHRQMVAGLLAADRFQLRLVGPIENNALDLTRPACSALLQAGCLHIDARMAPKAEATAEVLDADYLVLLDIVGHEAPSVQLPAKVFDYIRACRPILAFTPEGSVIRCFLAESGIPHLCISPQAPISAIDAAIGAFLAQPAREVAPSEVFWRRFDASEQTQTLAAVIASVSPPPAA